MADSSNLSILEGPKRALKPNLIHRHFEEIARGAHKNDIAIIYECSDRVKTITYKQLDTATNKIARAIVNCVEESKKTRNSDGDWIVGVSMSPSDKMIVALLAILKSGAAYLPIHPDFPRDRTEHILTESAPVLVLCDTDFPCPGLAPTRTFDSLLEASREFPHDSLAPAECLAHEKDNLAVVMYTSGSTGAPKGVRLSHEVHFNRLQWQIEVFPFTCTEKIVAFKTAITFVDSLSEIWNSLLQGLAMLVVPTDSMRDPEKLVNLLDKYKIERIFLVPSLLQALCLYLDLKKDEKVLKNLKICLCGGEPMAVSLARDFFKRLPENELVLCNFYGSTEVAGDVSCHVLSRLDLEGQEQVPIGLPVHNTNVYLLDEQLRAVEIGALGQLWASGYNLAAGYVRGRESERFIANPFHGNQPGFSRLYRTGDYARIKSGTIYYEGRTDSQVKVRGHRVDLAEIESAVTSVATIDQAVVLCYHPGDPNQALLAFISLKGGCALNEVQIESILQKKLVSYMQPQVIILEKIPRLVNGKSDRQSLLKLYENMENTGAKIEYCGVPEGQMEVATVLLDTVASVLNRSARAVVSIAANFYDIGGNSLNSIVTVTKLAEQGYAISIADFINAASLREVLNHLCSETPVLPANAPKCPQYSSEMLTRAHKPDVLRIIVDSFYDKGYIVQWLKPELTRDDYTAYQEAIFEAVLLADLSFVTKNPSGKIVGVSLNFDARLEPEVKVESRMADIVEYTRYVEAPIREEKFPTVEGNILYAFLMGTDASLNAKENIFVMQFMEEEMVRVARSKNFCKTFSTNTSPLSQQIISIDGYEIVSEWQVNQYVCCDGSKPFSGAPDSQKVVVCWKTI